MVVWHVLLAKERILKGTVINVQGRDAIKPWEDLLKGLEQPAESNNGIGLIARMERAPRKRRRDPLIEEIYAIKDLGHVLIQIPRGVVPACVEHSNPEVGIYWVFTLGDRNSGLTVHLHKSLLGQEQQVISGRVRLCVRRWYLIDKHGRTPKMSTNYKVHLDVTPWTGEGGPTLRLREPADTAGEFYFRENEDAIMFGEPDEDGVRAVAHRSIEWDPEYDHGVNQYFELVPYDVSDCSVVAPEPAPRSTGMSATFAGVDLSRFQANG